MTTYDQNMFLYWFTKTEEHSYAIVVGWMKIICLVWDIRHITWPDNRGIRWCISPLRSLLTWHMPRSALSPREAWNPLIHLDPHRWVFSHHFTGEHSLWWCRKLEKSPKSAFSEALINLLFYCWVVKADKSSKTKLWLCKCASQSELTIVSYPTDLH